MAKQLTKPPAKAGYKDTRFNATKYGILSRYTVLPWEDADEYRELHEALIEEYKPVGPTEGHLVEELAGIMWRKQRLRVAEAGSARQSLDAVATKLWQSQRNTFFDVDAILNDEEEPDEEFLSLIAIPPHEVPAALRKIEGKMRNADAEDRDFLERQHEVLLRYSKMHEAAQSNVAAEAKFEKLARYETHLDRKFERTLTVLLRMQEFRARSTAADQG